MQISDGWATEYNRKRWGVVLEESDWLGLLIDHGISTDVSVPLVAKYQIMRLQASLLSLEASIAYLISERENVDAEGVKLTAVKEELTTWLAALKQKYPA